MSGSRAERIRGIACRFHRTGRYLAQRSFPAGVTLPQYLMLRELQGRDLRPSDLASRLGVTPGSITPLVDRLLEAGWVQRRPEETDRRAQRLSLTADGCQRLTTIERCHGAVWEQLVAGISDQELDALHGFLDRMTRSLGPGCTPESEEGGTPGG